MQTYLVTLIALIVIAALFSGAEIAFTSISPSKAKAFKDDHRFGYKIIYRLKQMPEYLLITILIINNLATILATALATFWATKAFGNHAVGIVTGALTFTLLIFGELTPKSIAQKYAEFFSRMMAYPLLWLVYLLYPIVWCLRLFIHGLMKLFNAKNPIRSMSEKELLALVDIGTQEGVIEKHEQEFIENILEFTDTRVEEIMTIEKNIDALEASTSINDAVKFFVEHTHSRIPVYKRSLDNIIGILSIQHLLRISYDPQGKKTLADLEYSHVIISPRTQMISKLFHQFQKRRQHLAIVVNEHGETIGLVSLEDILEEIVGEIVDEHDRELKKIHKVEKNTWEAMGDATIEEINEALDIEIPYPEHQTISLLILEKLQDLPRQGQKINYDHLLIQVKSMSRNKINSILISKLSDDEI
jgi:CBS domain containing-hemolysin-like protein